VFLVLLSFHSVRFRPRGKHHRQRHEVTICSCSDVLLVRCRPAPERRWRPGALLTEVDQEDNRRRWHSRSVALHPTPASLTPVPPGDVIGSPSYPAFEAFLVGAASRSILELFVLSITPPMPPLCLALGFTSRLLLPASVVPIIASIRR